MPSQAYVVSALVHPNSKQSHGLCGVTSTVSAELEAFLAEMFSREDPPTHKPHPNPLRVSRGWKPSHPKEEPPF